MSTIASPPLQNDLILQISNQDGSISRPMDPVWLIWLQQSLIPRVEAPSQVIGTVSLTGKTATILTTPIPLATIAAGLYRLTWYARVTTVAGVASSFQVTIGWTDTGTAQSFQGALANGNLTTTLQSTSVMVSADQASSLTYAIAYASNPAATMAFRFDLVVELVEAQ